MYDIGAELFRWQFATAVAGSILGVNPFDQPDVRLAKERTEDLLAEHAASGSLPRVDSLSLEELISRRLAPGGTWRSSRSSSRRPRRTSPWPR